MRHHYPRASSSEKDKTTNFVFVAFIGLCREYTSSPYICLAYAFLAELDSPPPTIPLELVRISLTISWFWWGLCTSRAFLCSSCRSRIGSPYRPSLRAGSLCLNYISPRTSWFPSNGRGPYRFLSWIHSWARNLTNLPFLTKFSISWRRTCNPLSNAHGHHGIHITYCGHACMVPTSSFLAI